MCICGATNVLADDLLPNKTVRDTIVRILEANNSSGDNGGSAFQPQGLCFIIKCYSNIQLYFLASNFPLTDMESARSPQRKIPSPKVPSPTLSAASKGGLVIPKNEDNANIKEMTEPIKVVNNTQNNLDKVTVEKGAEFSEATHDSRNAREPGSQMCPPVTDEEMQHKPVSGEVGKYMAYK